MYEWVIHTYTWVMARVRTSLGTRVYESRAHRSSTATHCNTLQDTTTHYNALQRTATHCSTRAVATQRSHCTHINAGTVNQHKGVMAQHKRVMAQHKWVMAQHRRVMTHVWMRHMLLWISYGTRINDICDKLYAIWIILQNASYRAKELQLQQQLQLQQHQQQQTRMLQAASRCNTLQHTAAHYYTLQRTATDTATRCNKMQDTAAYCKTRQRNAAN